MLNIVRFALIILILSSVDVAADVTNGIVAWWKFDDAAGVTADDNADRFGASANDGTLTNGPTWSTGKLGGALSFDYTSSQYVSLSGATFPNLNNTFTIAAWVYINAAATRCIFGQSNTAGAVHLRVGRNTGNNRHIAAYNGTTVLAAVADDTVPIGVWTHIVYVRNATANAIYLDGVSQVLTVDSTTQYTNTTNNKQIGQRGNGTEYWNGKIDDLRIYNRALSKAEVWDIFQGSSQNFGGE